VTERLENEPGMLATFEAAALIPAPALRCPVSVDGSVAVDASQHVIALSRPTSAAILVRRSATSTAGSRYTL
jgi:hypothetical protein